MSEYKGKCNQGNFCGTQKHRKNTKCPNSFETNISKNSLTASKPNKMDDVTTSVVELSFVQGTSDKFYRVETSGVTVTVTYGRNGTVGTQSVKSFDNEQAADKFAKSKLNSKLKKGYRPVDPNVDNSVVLNEFEGPNVDAVPMLAKVGSPHEVQSMIVDDMWCAQVKMDGDRLVMVFDDGKRGAFNRQGMTKQRNVGRAHFEAFEKFGDGWIFDGEVVGTTYHVFDVIKAPGLADDASFEDRYGMLVDAFYDYGLDDNPAVELVETVYSTEAKQFLREGTMKDKGEGLIFRRKDASYSHGRSDTLIKDKFTKTADVVVMSNNSDTGKDSVEVGIHVNGVLRRVGSLSTIGKGDVKPGDVVEASFKHVIDPLNPVLVEGRIERVRDDKSVEECDIEQFENAGTNIGKS